MSLYAVKNDKGEWLGWDIYQDDPEFISGGGSVWTDLDKAKFYAKANGGHVVELVDAPAKVVVSEEEAEMLEWAKGKTFPAIIFDSGAAGCLPGSQDRLMRAYVNGWTVEKPKRYVLPMPGTEYRSKLMHGNAQYYAIKGTENWRPDATALGTGDAVKHGYTVTKSEIETAPGWVKAITPVEVTDDEQ